MGDSNFHENITYDPANPQEAANVKLAVKNMVARALEMDGTCTGEHGVGIGKKAALLSEIGEDTVTVMVSKFARNTNVSMYTNKSSIYQRLIKSVLDPHWIMYVSLKLLRTETIKLTMS